MDKSQKYYDEDREVIQKVHEVGSIYIRNYAYEHGDAISDFMKHYGIGESAYGELMDAAAHGKKVMAHRLFGHHIVYDFPFNEPDKIFDFLTHELSDIFTKQGLPILPGELVKTLL